MKSSEVLTTKNPKRQPATCLIQITTKTNAGGKKKKLAF